MINYFKKNSHRFYLYLILSLFVSTYFWYVKTTGVFLGIDKFEMFFFDADDYMMLTRIRDFFYHGTTSYSLINRVNVPNGADLYWTHLYDSILISLSWIVSLFTSSIDKAIEVVGFFLAPIFRLFCALGLVKIFLKISPKIIWITPILFLLHFCLGEIFALGRPDHHAFIMFLEILFLYFLREFIFANYSEKDENDSEKKIEISSICFAIITSLCIWSSTETLPLILITEVVLFFAGEKISPLVFYKKNLLTAIFISLILITNTPVYLIEILLFSALYFFTKKTSEKNFYLHFPVLFLIFYLSNFSEKFFYDELSRLHLSLYIFACFYFGIMHLLEMKFSQKKRFVFGIFCGAILGAIFLYLYPNFLLGIEGDASKFLREYWFPTITDLISVLELPYIVFVIVFWINSSTLFVAAYDKLISFRQKKIDGRNLFWLVLIILAISYSVFAIMACRMVLTFYLLMLPVVTEFCIKRFKRKIGNWLASGLIIIPTFGYILFTTSGGLFDWSILDTLALYKRNNVEFFKNLDKISDEPKVIMSDPYSGPKILYFSKQKVVVVPFHRQEKGLIASLIITQWKDYNEKLSINALQKTNSTYMLVRRSNQSPDNLEGRVSAGYIPKWISLEFMDANRELCIAKIDKEQMKKSSEDEE